MNVVEPLIIGVVVLVSTLLSGYLLRNRVYRGMSEYLKADLVEWMALEENQAALGAYIENAAEVVRSKTVASLAGMFSGISRGAQALENELGEEAVQTMFSGNELVAGIFSKYVADKPLVRDIVLNMAKNTMVKQAAGAPGGLLQAPMDK